MAQGKSSGRAWKEQVVAGLQGRLSGAEGLVLASFGGLTVAEMEEIRRGLRQQGVEFLVVKNRLVRRATQGAASAKLADYFVGPTALALSRSDSSLAAKILTDFAKSQPKLKIKGGLLRDRALSPEKVKELASLPPREVLLAQLLGGLKAPMTSLVGVLSATLRKFVGVLEAIKEKKEA